MFIVRNFIVDGLADRAQAKIKVRQPLASATLFIHDRQIEDAYIEIIKAELNVKKAKISRGKAGVLPHLEIDTKLTPELKAEGIMRELVRHVQNARKNAGLNVDDRIKLRLESDSKEVNEAVKGFKNTIFAETLATSELKGEGDYNETVKVEGQEVKISLKRVVGA